MVNWTLRWTTYLSILIFALTIGQIQGTPESTDIDDDTSSTPDIHHELIDENEESDLNVDPDIPDLDSDIARAKKRDCSKTTNCPSGYTCRRKCPARKRRSSPSILRDGEGDKAKCTTTPCLITSTKALCYKQNSYCCSGKCDQVGGTGDPVCCEKDATNCTTATDPLCCSGICKNGRCCGEPSQTAKCSDHNGCCSGKCIVPKFGGSKICCLLAGDDSGGDPNACCSTKVDPAKNNVCTCDDVGSPCDPASAQTCCSGQCHAERKTCCVNSFYNGAKCGNDNQCCSDNCLKWDPSAAYGTCCVQGKGKTQLPVNMKTDADADCCSNYAVKDGGCKFCAVYPVTNYGPDCGQ